MLNVLFHITHLSIEEGKTIAIFRNEYRRLPGRRAP